LTKIGGMIFIKVKKELKGRAVRSRILNGGKEENIIMTITEKKMIIIKRKWVITPINAIMEIRVINTKRKRGGKIDDYGK
jgi:hypothetical protein